MSQVDFEPRDAKYELRKIADLVPWVDNPRSITDKEFERLQEHVRRLGFYKPLLINQNNIVLGGNMRLRALRDLGYDEVMCTVVLTDNRQQMIEYALSDNDQMGTTDEQKVAELVLADPIKTELFAVHVSKPRPVETVLKSFAGPEEPPQNSSDGCKHCPLHCGEDNL